MEDDRVRIPSRRDELLAVVGVGRREFGIDFSQDRQQEIARGIDRAAEDHSVLGHGDLHAMSTDVVAAALGAFKHAIPLARQGAKGAGVSRARRHPAFS